jgi:hypothetical protein
LSHHLRPPREGLAIIHYSTTAQIKQVFAFPAVPRPLTWPVPDVRPVVFDANLLAQCGSPFTRALSHTPFLQPFLLGVELDVAPALAPRAARPPRA